MGKARDPIQNVMQRELNAIRWNLYLYRFYYNISEIITYQCCQ